MNLYGIFHEAKSKYAYAFDKDTLHIRLRTAIADVSEVTLLWGDPFDWRRSAKNGSREWVMAKEAPMQMIKEYSDALFDYWFIQIKPAFKRTRYAFVLKADSKQFFYGAHGAVDLNLHPETLETLNDYFNFPYLNQEDVFEAPAWVKDTVWYQIFPERFANGDDRLNKPGILPWGSETQVTNEMHFGGDLKGVIDHLDYIADLGATGIYFTPIFEAPTTHKYDTIDYYKIDPEFGTNETFKILVEEAHKRGIRVMLDAVFNHCGFKHPYFQDVVKNGMASPYAPCFHILREPIINFPLNAQGFPAPKGYMEAGALNFETFAFTPNMPKWRTANPIAEAHLLDVAKYWIEKYDIDGWRLDVSNEVSHAFWRKFKTTVRAIKEDVFILGENWDDSTPWLKGDQFDSVMNYEFTFPVWHLLSRAPEYADFGAKAFKESISRLLVSYPKHVAVNMFNLLDSHDTSRLRTQLSEDDRLVKLAFVLQLTFGGSPSVYYGSEVGLFGVHDGNRQCMIWEEENQNRALHDHVKRMIALRHKHPALKAIDLKWLPTNLENEILGYAKTAADETVIMLYNISDAAQTIDVKETLGAITRDIYRDEPLSDTEKLEITLPPYGFRLLK